METLLHWLIPAGVAAVAALLATRRGAGAWRAAARELDFDLSLTPGATGWRMSGTLRGLPVQVQLLPATERRRGRHTRVRVELGAGLPPDLEVGPRRVGDGGAGVDVGDPAFEAVARARGDEVTLVAILTHANRRRLRELVRDGARVEARSVVVDQVGVVTDPTALVRLIRRVAQAADGIDLERRGVPHRLAIGVRQEPEPAQRIRRLRLLDAGWPDSAHRHRALRAALADPDPRVRVEAAERAGGEGVAVLRAVIESAAPEGTRVAALDALADAPCNIHPVLDAVLAEPARGALWRRAVRLCGRVNYAEAVPTLLEAVALVSGEEAVALAEALGQLSGAEEGLVALLDGDGQRAAIEALGRRGSSRAIGPLRGLTGGLLRDAEIKEAASLAIERIERRCGQVAAGGLSLAEAGGELSPADDQV